jgi:YD repeat-containing protein
MSPTSSFAYDTFGNLVKPPDAEYSYDLHDRLCEIRKIDGAVVKYSYDALGQSCELR